MSIFRAFASVFAAFRVAVVTGARAAAGVVKTRSAAPANDEVFAR